MGPPIQYAKTFRGRGAPDNPPNRFVRIEYIRTDDDFIENQSSPQTEFYRDPSRKIITYNKSPDVGFEASINPYRGCEHGCIYCYARPTHEYLGFSAGLDFETKIIVKENAPKLLAKELSSHLWKPQIVVISGVTDPYQPIERNLKITRQCLRVFQRFRNPIGIVTKNYLVTRDIDILSELSKYNAVIVTISITTLDSSLAQKMEPRTSGPARRLETIAKLGSAGIPTGVMIAPVIPGLNDHEIPKIIAEAKEAGADYATYTMLRLPLSVAPLFERWLDQHFPARKNKILNRIKAVRMGKLNETRFHDRMRGHGVWAKQIKDLFDIGCKSAGIKRTQPELSIRSFKVQKSQLSLF